MKNFYFNNVQLTESTILKTRKHFHDICIDCIEEAKSGKVFVNDLEKYIKQEEKEAKKYLAGEHDHVFTFLQRAYWIQTGEMVPLLSF